MSRTFPMRSQAAQAAQRELGEGKFFRTTQDAEGDWKWHYEPGGNPVALWALGKDWVAWVETDWFRDEDPMVKVGVLVVTCQRAEIEQAEYLGIPEPFVIEPITPELWEDPKAPAKARTSSTGTRARSDVENPTKLVWRLADAMTGATRGDVVAACVFHGVNKATASTQYYRWQKARATST